MLILAEQWVGAAAIALFSVFMAYWTSPLRSGQHTSLATARERDEGTAIILWAPGNPLSSRLQIAIRNPREDVAWVNVYRDQQAQQLLAENGGAESLPLVLLGEKTHRRVSASELLELQDAARRRRDEGGTTVAD